MPAIAAWHALFLGPIYVSCMMSSWMVHAHLAKPYASPPYRGGCLLHSWHGTGASEVLPVYGTWPVTSWKEDPTAVQAMARGLRAPVQRRRWIALTASGALFHSLILLSVSRPQSYSPQVLLCQTLRYSPVWHQVSLFPCPVIPFPPIPSPRTICLLQSMFWVLRSAWQAAQGWHIPPDPNGRAPELPLGVGSNLRECCSHPAYLHSLPQLQNRRCWHALTTDSTDFARFFF